MKTMKPSKNQNLVKSRVVPKLASIRVFSLEVKLNYSSKNESETGRMPDREVSHLPRHPKPQPQPQLLQARSRGAKKVADLVQRQRTKSNYCR